MTVVAALSTPACGRAPEWEHVDRIRRLCTALAATSAGAAEAERAFGGPPQLELCAPELPPASASDRCPRDGAPVCLRVWAWRGHDQSLCGGAGCSYGCELRAPEGAPEQTCSVRFLSGFEQPSP